MLEGNLPSSKDENNSILLNQALCKYVKQTLHHVFLLDFYGFGLYFFNKQTLFESNTPAPRVCFVQQTYIAVSDAILTINA